MTDSRTRILTFALAFALSASAAWAQSADAPPSDWKNDLPPVADDEATTPVAPAAAAAPDLPPVADDETVAPAVPAATAAPQPLSEPVTQQSIPAPQDAGIQVGTLGTVEGPAVGLLDSSNGGLGEDMWSGSSRSTVEDLLVRAPLISSDPAMRALSKRIVLTKAASPVAGSAKRALVTVRIEKLLDAGLIEEAGALASQALVANDPDFARVQADALLIANRAGDVCSDKTTARLSAAEPFWLQLRAYCYTIGGDQAAADLTHAVIEAQGYTDKAFETLLDDVLNHTATPPGPIAHPTAMHIFLLQQAGLPIPAAVAAAMGTPENLLVVRDTRNSPRQRLDAADRIVRTGAVPVGELKALADAQDIPLDRMANALADAQVLPFFAGQVLLRRAAQIEPRPDAKADIVFAALSLGEKAGLFALAAGLQGDVAASLKPTPSNRGKAGRIARALLLAGRPEAASRWLTDRDVGQTVLALAAPTPARDAKAQAAFSAYAAGLVKNPPDPDADRPYKALVLGVADVLGLPLPPDAKAQAPAIEAQDWGGTRPDPDTMQNIERASMHPERKGEALLLILDTVRSIGLRNLAPNATIEFVRLLGAMGLPDAAHDLGMEAMMLYVPPPPPPAAPAQ